MLATSRSGFVLGIDAHPVEVQVDISPGLPYFNIVGLPEASVKESRERVKSAIKNCGYPFPTNRITINLAPADVKKEGSGLDLPIALAILCAQEVIPQEELSKYAVVGELSLDGAVKKNRGILPLSLAAKGWDGSSLIVPDENAQEASVVEGTDVYPANHLSQVVQFLSKIEEITPQKTDIDALFSQHSTYHFGFQDVIGQEHAKRALEIAAAGGHNVLMIGPPGSGKTMLARRLPTILPPLTFEEAIETTAVYSVSGLLPGEMPLMTQRPFCSPHHTISDAGLIGGGAIPRPGQVSLAHNGVLFLDELPEFKKNVLESLRQPLEDGHVTISRASITLSFPSRFSLVCAQNPCPCGHFGDSLHSCMCNPRQISMYRSRISGPLLDRIDIQIEVPAVPYKELGKTVQGENSDSIRKRVISTRDIQSQRFKDIPIHCNAQMSSREIRKLCKLSGACSKLLETVSKKLGLSARAYHRIIKIARTIADIEGAPDILEPHIAEAIQYRSLDRNRPA